MIALSLLLAGCTVDYFDVETALTVEVDGTTEVEISALIESGLVRPSELALVRVTATPTSDVDLDLGYLFLGPSEPETEEEASRMAGTQIFTRFGPLDGVVESFITTRPATIGQVCNAEECVTGYCVDSFDCNVPFTLVIEPREQVFTVDLRVQLHVQIEENTRCSGSCGVDVTAEPPQ